MNALRKIVLGTLVGACIAMGLPAAAIAQGSDATKAIAARAFSGIADAVDAQSAFGDARAESDEAATQQASAAMLLGLARAKFWLAVLDAQVDQSTHSVAIDADVQELNELVGGALDRVDDLLYANDMDGLEAALDDAADTFTGLHRSMVNLLDVLFPKRG